MELLWNDDPEELLLELGFGCDEPDLSGLIPARFINYQSQARGINLQVYLEAMKSRIDLENPDVSNRFRQLEVLQQVSVAFSSLAGNQKGLYTKDMSLEARERRKRMGMLLRRASKKSLSQLHRQANQEVSSAIVPKAPESMYGAEERKVAYRRVKRKDTVGISPFVEEEAGVQTPTPEAEAMTGSVRERNMDKALLRKKNLQMRESFEMEELGSFEDSSTIGQDLAGTHFARGLIRVNSCQSDSSGFLEDFLIPALPQDPSPASDLLKALSALSGGSTDSHSGVTTLQNTLCTSTTSDHAPEHHPVIRSTLSSNQIPTAISDSIASSPLPCSHQVPDERISENCDVSLPSNNVSSIILPNIGDNEETPADEIRSSDFDNRHNTLGVDGKYESFVHSPQIEISKFTHSAYLDTFQHWKDSTNTFHSWTKTTAVSHFLSWQNSFESLTMNKDGPVQVPVHIKHILSYSDDPIGQTEDVNLETDIDQQIERQGRVGEQKQNESFCKNQNPVKGDCVDGLYKQIDSYESLTMYEDRQVHDLINVDGNVSYHDGPRIRSYHETDIDQQMKMSGRVVDQRQDDSFHHDAMFDGHVKHSKGSDSIKSLESELKESQFQNALRTESMRTISRRDSFESLTMDEDGPVREVISGENIVSYPNDPRIQSENFYEESFHHNSIKKNLVVGHGKSSDIIESLSSHEDGLLQDLINESVSYSDGPRYGDVFLETDIDEQVETQDRVSKQKQDEKLFQNSEELHYTDEPYNASEELNLKELELIEVESLDDVFETSVDNSEIDMGDADMFLLEMNSIGQVYWAEPVQITDTSPLSGSLEDHDNFQKHSQLVMESDIDASSTHRHNLQNDWTITDSITSEFNDKSSLEPLTSQGNKTSRRSVSVQQLSSSSSHIVQRKDVPYADNPKHVTLPRRFKLDTSDPFRAVQSWTNLHIQHNPKGTKSSNVPAHEWQSDDCLHRISREHESRPVSMDTGLWTKVQDEEVDRSGGHQSGPLCDHTCCKQSGQHHMRGQGELDTLLYHLQRFCCVLGLMEEHVTEEQAGVYSALSPHDRVCVEELLQLRQAVRQEAVELDKHLSDLGPHHDFRLIPKIVQLLEEQSLLCSQLHLFSLEALSPVSGALIPVPGPTHKRTVATQCSLQKGPHEAPGPPQVQAALSQQALGCAPAKDKRHLVGLLHRVSDVTGNTQMEPMFSSHHTCVLF